MPTARKHEVGTLNNWEWKILYSLSNSNNLLVLETFKSISLVACFVVLAKKMQFQFLRSLDNYEAGLIFGSIIHKKYAY